LKPLTDREHEVMQLLCLGYVNKSIADYLGCSIKTVEKHRQAIYFKWRVNNITAMIRVALRTNHFAMTDFFNSKIGEDSHHQIPQNLE
jgi:DNA-binding NarL/FixJ family response regulator